MKRFYATYAANTLLHQVYYRDAPKNKYTYMWRTYSLQYSFKLDQPTPVAMVTKFSDVATYVWRL